MSAIINRKSFVSRILLFFMTALLALTMLIVPVSAKNVCKQISGSSAGTKTFTVETGSRWIFSDKIKLKQTKGTYKYQNWRVQYKTAKGYDYFRVTVEKIKGGKYSTKTYTFNKSSLTIKLDKNCTYRITVKPGTSADMQIGHLLKGVFYGWKTYPTWKVTSTKGILSCG